MGGKRPPAPLVALSLLLGLLALKELAMPTPYRAAPQPAGKGGELEDDDADADPFDFSEDGEEEGGKGGGGPPEIDPGLKLEKWLLEKLDEVDAQDAAFQASSDGIDTLGDLMDIDPLQEDFVDWGLSITSAKRLRRALDDVQDTAGIKRRRASSDDGGSFRAGSKPPVSPANAALAAGLKYVFYGGMILMWFGERLFGILGMLVPAWHRTLIANKTQVMIGLMVLSQMGPMMLGA